MSDKKLVKTRKDHVCGIVEKAFQKELCVDIGENRKHSREPRINKKGMNLLTYPKRKDFLVMKPYYYGIECDICGGTNIHWSEWDGLIWCYDCQMDTKGTPGIFGGPIPIKVCTEIFGLSFDRIDLETKTVIKFDKNT